MGSLLESVKWAKVRVTSVTADSTVLAGRIVAARGALRRHGGPLALALVAGAILRLLWIGDTSFLGDQAELLALGRSAADHHAFIATGILSSIGTLNPPLSGWLYAPFALVGGPVAGAVFTALVNVLAIALLYGLTTRFGGRLAGFIAALLYATASGPIHFSRFIWQQNLMAPLLVLLLGAVLLGTVEGRAGWLGWAALFWGASVQLHPTALALLSVFALALALTWRRLRRRDIAWAAGALALLYAPTLLWEAASGGGDLAALTRFGGRGSVTDLTALYHTVQMLIPAFPEAYGATSSYAAFGATLAPAGVVIVLAGLASWIWLAAITLSPWAPRNRARGGWRAIIATPRWRLAAILLVWQFTPLVLLLHHNKPVPEHYVLIILPVIYLTIGLWVVDAARWLDTRFHDRYAGVTRAGVVALTLCLALAQTVGVAAELWTVHSGAYDGLAVQTHLGIPLAGQQETLATAARAATRLDAPLALATGGAYQGSYAYLARTDGIAASVYPGANCVVAPSAASARPLVTLVFPQSFAASALDEMTGVRALGTLDAQGSAPLHLYALAPGAAPRGEVTLNASGTDSSPRLAGYSLGQTASGASYLTLLWSGAPRLRVPAGQDATYWYGATSGGPVVATYQVSAQPLDANGRPAGQALHATCDWLAWEPGTDMVMWVSLPAGSPSAASWRVTLAAAPLMATRPHLGPLPLETGDVTFRAPQAIAGPVVFTTR